MVVLRGNILWSLLFVTPVDAFLFLLFFFKSRITTPPLVKRKRSRLGLEAMPPPPDFKELTEAVCQLTSAFSPVEHTNATEHQDMMPNLMALLLFGNNISGSIPASLISQTGPGYLRQSFIRRAPTTLLE
ncbi:hypothetical protein IFM89_007581 [Coptis chinensis]|uniref:Uncharacterized protein n=1 Tax=Coptis chinensis TaxID=261450 RepID=A0A835GX36_9MAGN|nr:hypothetical protein IFM89_007581 [Coptis chinensis]